MNFFTQLNCNFATAPEVCLKVQCHEIFDFSFFSLGPFRIFRKFDGDIRRSRCATVVIDTAPLANLLPVSLIQVLRLVLRISPQIVEKVRDDHHVIFMGLGEVDP